MLCVADVVAAVQHAPVLYGADGIVEIVALGRGGRGVSQELGDTQAFQWKLHKIADFAAAKDLSERVSHITRRTSHVTRHTSHVTRHTSYATRHTPHVTRHTSHVARHARNAAHLAHHAVVSEPL